ncbi:MAG: hypothetical protein A2033_06420 [Bacteroidetes bacterium GWA2_31_9]|nr:MAG: hypothetical protein A2033_06420 [Bacteroidetes bacterium GWA2_31_9]
MQKLNFKMFVPHLVAIVVFLSITFAYFSPLLDGKRVSQSDMNQYLGMSKEITDFKEKTGEQTLWTNSMFGGMPAYLISVEYSANLVRYANLIMNLGLEKPANYLFISLIGFYILLLIFGVNPWLAIGGAIAYSFSSYFFIIEAVGHNTKALALAYMPPIIGGVVLAYRKKIIAGSAIAGLFLALQLLANHFQITYYTLLIVLVFILFFFYKSIIEKAISKFFKSSAVLAITILLAFSTNITSLWLVYEYGKESMRGKSELTEDQQNKTGGLDKDYATAWSYGISESWTLLVPNFMGGASIGEVGKNSATFKALKDNGVPNTDAICKQLPLYWGDQPGTSGPVYVGAIIFFLFIFGLFYVKGYIKWWLLTATIFALFLSWGRNFMFFTDLFLDYFPGYDKFRTVSMILIIIEFAMPLLGILALKQFIENSDDKARFMKAFKIAIASVGGILLIFAVMPGMFFNFSAASDAQLISNGWPEFLVNAIKEDRKSMLTSDAFRSLIFILLFAGAMLAFYFKKLSVKYVYISLALLLIFDMWTVNKRYLNNDNFTAKREATTPFKPTQADIQILQDKDPDFRVLNLSVSTFNDASTSYFHKSIGGYHGAKMKRYQEIIEKQISKNNMSVLNMLNTKYFIVPTKDQGAVVQKNYGALGNAWFVSNYKLVENADSEIVALDNFNPAETLIVDKRFENKVKGFVPKIDSTAIISLTDYKPNHLTYKSKSSIEQLTAFSEIYYNSGKGWNSYIDGKAIEHFRANYVLRAMKIPAGEHTVEFKFEPSAYATGETISFASSALLVLMCIGAIVMELKAKKD